MVQRFHSLSASARFIAPCLPSRAASPPAGPGWLHEIKHDGFRLLVLREGERVKLFTRRGFDFSSRYPMIVATALSLPATSFLIDGEAVACGDDGLPAFDLLRYRRRDGTCQRF
jgi:bifunctional non-homologous end joining protein LigD